MIERDRTPATARDGEDAAGGSDSQNPPKLAVGGDDEGDDEGEGEDYVYVGDDWKDVGPSLIPSIVTACLGAFLFGYHSAVINAPLADIAEDLGFGGDNFAKGAVVSIMVVGGFAGGSASARSRIRRADAARSSPRRSRWRSAPRLRRGELALDDDARPVHHRSRRRRVDADRAVYLSEVSPPGLRGTVNGIRHGIRRRVFDGVPTRGPAERREHGREREAASTLNQSAGLDTYIDAVRSEGKFAVVVEKVKETAAAAERDLVVRVEEKVERLEEKLGGKGSGSASPGRRRRFRNAVPAPTSARSPAAAGFTGADAKPAPAVKASAERSSPSEAANRRRPTRGTEKLEKSKVGEVIGGEDRDRDRARERRVETRRR